MAIERHSVEHATADGTVLRGSIWPAASPRAVLVLAHGINEHIGRYAHLAERLTAAGYTLIGVDHRGHGLTAGESVRSSNIRRFDDHVDDYIAFFDACRATTSVPMVMLGHSMGGLIAIRAALRAQERAAALVLSGPALRIPLPMPKWRQRIAMLIARIRPGLALPPGDRDRLSKDPAVRLAIETDPLFSDDPVRLGIARQLMLLSAETLSRAGEIRILLLAMHGAADTITDPEGTRLFVERAASTDKEFVSWPDDLHEIFNEVDREVVIGHLISWLDHRFPIR